MSIIIYKINFIIITILLFSFTIAAQQERSLSIIEGSIRNDKGEPVEFATVFIKNTTTGTQTDSKGHFILRALSGKHTLSVTFMGYETYEKLIEIPSREKLYLSIILKEKQYNLEEVVVEGKSIIRRINESAFNVVSIDTKELYNTTMGIANALDRISGIKIREIGGLGSSTQISLNGFTGRHVKVFMDGIPMDGAGSSFQINNIPVNLAERIEVYKGVVPVEFGTDALGGAINIVTKQSSNTYLDASYSYGSFNTHKSNVSFGHTLINGLTFNLHAYQNYSDNNYKVKTKLLDVNTGSYSTEDYWFKRFHDNYHNEAIVANIGVVNKLWATQLLAGITLSREKADIQNANLMKIVYGGRKREARGVSPTLTYLKKNLIIENLSLSINAQYNQTGSNNIDTLARQYNWKGEWRNKSSKGEGQYSLSEFDNKNGTVTANITYNIGGKHFFVLNNLFNSFERKTTDAVANSENSIATTFMRRKNDKNVLGFSYKLAPTHRWNILGFIKYYDTKITGPVNISTGTSTSSYEEKTKSSNVTGYGFTATYYLNSSIQLKSSFEKAYRLPTERELFGDEILETGNTTLKPENSKNVNVNIRYDKIFDQIHTLIFDAGFIYRYTTDYIRRQIEQRYGGAFSTNHGKVRNVGMDFETRYFYKNILSIGGNITYQNMRNREKYSHSGLELIYYNDRIPNAPYWFGNIDASYNLKDVFFAKSLLTVGYNMRYVHEFFRDWESEGGDIIIPKQLSHDINLTYALKNGKYNISFEANNLTDEILYDNYSLQKPGRSFSFKLRYFFIK